MQYQVYPQPLFFSPQPQSSSPKVKNVPLGLETQIPNYNNFPQIYHPTQLSYEERIPFYKKNIKNYIFIILAVAFAVSGGGFIYGLTNDYDNDSTEVSKKKQRNVLYFISISMIVCAFLVFILLLIS
jgi:hypothetical protein